MGNNFKRKPKYDRTGQPKQKRVLNEQEIQYIKENAGKSGIKDIALALRTTQKRVTDVMNQYDLPRSTPGSAVEPPPYTGASSKVGNSGRKRNAVPQKIARQQRLVASYEQREKEFVPMLRVSVETGEVQYFGEGLR